MNWIIGINPFPHENYPPLGSNIAFRRCILHTNKDVLPSLLNPYAEDLVRFNTLLRYTARIKE